MAITTACARSRPSASWPPRTQRSRRPPRRPDFACAPPPARLPSRRRIPRCENGPVSDHEIVATHLRRSLDVLARAAGDAGFGAAMLAIAQAIEKSLRAGGKVMLA